MREPIFTIFQNSRDTNGRPISQTWDEWLELLSRHEVRGGPADSDDKGKLDRAKDGPAVVLGEIPAGKRRAGANVRAVHAMALDIEDRTDDEIVSSLEKLKEFEYIIYTTHKHGSEVSGGRARLRVIFPLEKPVEPSDYPSAWTGLNSLCGGLNDPQTRDVGRLHFLPSTFDLSVAWTTRNQGRWLKLSDLPEGDSVPTVSDSRELAEVRGRMRVIRKDHELKEKSKALLAGLPFAEPGERHNVVLSLTMWLARKDRHLRRGTLDALFQPSLAVMEEDSIGAPTLDEVFKAYEGAVEKVRESEKGDRERKTKAALEHQHENLLPYKNRDLERIAGRHGWEPQELKDRWIIQSEGGGWVLDASGEYRGPYSREDLGLVASKVLARAPVRLIDATKSGFRYRPIQEVVRECGNVADHIISDLTAERTTYDPVTRIVYEAVRPIRKDLDPKFDEDIDKWFRLLTGPLYPKVVDWLSCCPDLSKLLCAIYFDGVPGSGKTLFAHGAARIWTHGPPGDIEAVLNDFNDELTRCPLIVADEEMPVQGWKRKSVTASLRSMLSTTSRTLKRKYRPTSELQGAVRLIMTANNEFLLDSRDVSSSQDLDAIAQRFLYVHVSQEAADYLNDIPRVQKAYWGEAGIARHILWLAENHEVKEPGKRFWVEGDVSQMHRLLMTGSRWNSLCCEWLVRYLMDPIPYDSQAKGLVQIKERELLVNEQALIDGWDLYVKTRVDVETSKIGAALRAISKSTRRKQLRWQGKQIRYRVIDVDHLISWSDRYNIGDRETMLARLEGALDRGENVIDFVGDHMDYDDGPEDAEENT
jgi:hypothetical protein